jgi:probable HAF family extracellular repeat protein
MRDLGTLGGTDSMAYAINQSGTIVGSSTFDATGNTHAFIFENGQMTDLNLALPPGTGWTLTAAYGIDDRGDIVGQGTYNGQSQAFLLIAPEPASLSLLSLGGIALMVRRRTPR